MFLIGSPLSACVILCLVAQIADVCTGANLGLLKPTLQSSTRRFDGFAYKAVDGNDHTTYLDGFCAHTETEYRPWLMIDLQDIYDVTAVHITNQVHAEYSKTLHDFSVRVSDKPEISAEYQQCYMHNGLVGPGARKTMTCTNGPVTGRFVFIQIQTDSTTETIILCEVEIDGTLSKSVPASSENWIDYDGAKYLFVKETKPWLKAQGYCMEQGGTLAEPSDEDEQVWIADKAAKLGLVSPWLGFIILRDRTVCHADGRVIKYTGWGVGEPSNTKANENCIHISEYDQLWNDLRCDMELSFVCTKTEKWALVFKASKAIEEPVYDLWAGSESTSTLTPNMITLDTSCACHYKSHLVEQWGTLNIRKVKFSFYIAGGEVVSLVFDGIGSTKNDWFSKTRLQESPYDDLTSDSVTNFFSIKGCQDGNVVRGWYVSKNHGGCNVDSGWINVVDKGVCAYESETKPLFMFGKPPTPEPWASGTGGYADVMAIFINYA